MLLQISKQRKRDQEFLLMRGWKQCHDSTCAINGCSAPCNSIWQSPDGSKHPLIYLFDHISAIDVAEEDLLKESGWREIRIRTHVGDTSKEDSWYINPKTKRIFNKKDAIAIVRCYNSEEVMCLLTNRMNELVSKRRLKEGDLICLDCINGVYSIWI